MGFLTFFLVPNPQIWCFTLTADLNWYQSLLFYCSCFCFGFQHSNGGGDIAGSSFKDGGILGMQAGAATLEHSIERQRQCEWGWGGERGRQRIPSSLLASAEPGAGLELTKL